MAKIKRLLSDTKNAILAAGALAAAVVAVVAAAKTFLSIGNSPTPPALLAGIEDVTLETNVGLEEYEARDQRAELGSPRESLPAQTGYLLAAYTTATGATTATQPATGTPETDTTSTSTSTPEPSPESKPPTSGGESSNSDESGATNQTRRSHDGARPVVPRSPYVYKRTKLSENAIHDPGGGSGPSGVKFVKPPAAATSFKRERKTRARTLTGTGASTSQVEGLLAAASKIAPSESGVSPSKEESLPYPQAAAKVALPSHCDASCPVAPMIDQILADNSSPAAAAKKVAGVFTHSRGRFYDHELHPLGADVEYTLKLTGFVHNVAILEWTLWSQSTGRPLPRSWWQSVIVKQIKPSRYEETISGTFWAPIPPKPGDYVFHLAVYDEHGNRRGHGRTPVFH